MSEVEEQTKIPLVSMPFERAMGLRDIKNWAYLQPNDVVSMPFERAMGLRDPRPGPPAARAWCFNAL